MRCKVRKKYRNKEGIIPFSYSNIPTIKVNGYVFSLKCYGVLSSF